MGYLRFGGQALHPHHALLPRGAAQACNRQRKGPASQVAASPIYEKRTDPDGSVRFFHICFRHSRFGAECRTEGESFGPGSATRRPFIGKATTPRREQHRNKGTSTSIDKTTVPQRALHAAMKLPSRSATSARRGTGHPCPCSALDTRGCSCRTRAHACRAASAQAAKRPPPPVPLRRARRCRPATSCYNQFMR